MISVPPKYSSEWWAALISGAVLFGLATATTLWAIGFVADIMFMLLVILGSLLGDVVLALAFDAINPTKVFVGPGDRTHNGSVVREKAVVVTPFGENKEGCVLVRGETWQARSESSDIASLQAGDPVKVLDRMGLVLIVERASNDI